MCAQFTSFFSRVALPCGLSWESSLHLRWIPLYFIETISLFFFSETEEQRTIFTHTLPCRVSLKKDFSQFILKCVPLPRRQILLSPGASLTSDLSKWDGGPLFNHPVLSCFGVSLYFCLLLTQVTCCQRHEW